MSTQNKATGPAIGAEHDGFEVVQVRARNTRRILFGLGFDLLDACSLREWVRDALRQNARCLKVAFSNPEFVVETLRNPALRRYLNSCDLNLLDGVGLVLAFRYIRAVRAPARLTGTHFVGVLAEEAAAAGSRLFLFGGKPGVAARAAERLRSKYPALTVCGTLDGYEGSLRALDTINAAQPDVLMVCLGNPKQEEWIEGALPALSVRLVFGNGGALDFWSGDVPVAPAFIQQAGLEWLFRLVTNFSRARLRRQIRLVRFVRLLLSERRERQA